MKSGLLFDLDGTLVDSLPGIAASLNRGLVDLGRNPHPEPVVRGFIGDGMRMLATRALGSDANDDAMVEDLFSRCAADYARTWSEGTIIYPGISELLADLKSRRVPLAVLSNKPHQFTMEIVEKLFPRTFDFTLGQRDGIPHKPDPTGALEICKLLLLSPGKSLLIGDSVMDLETARRAGMASIAVSWGYHDRDRLSSADHIVDDPQALAGLLLG